VVNPNSPTTVAVHALEFGAGKPSLLPIEQLPVRPCNFGFWTLHGHTPPSQMAWASKLRVDDGYLRGSRRPWPALAIGYSGWAYPRRGGCSAVAMDSMS
jgi:hypothetical protein